MYVNHVKLWHVEGDCHYRWQLLDDSNDDYLLRRDAKGRPRFDSIDASFD